MIDASVLGRKWIIRESDEREVLRMQQQLGVDPGLAMALSGRGVTADQAKTYLLPSLKDQMPDPVVLTDMSKAVERLVSAIKAQETIGIFGDYDVDGTTSAALLSRYFSALNVAHIVYLPDRLTEGYGPNLAAFQKIQAQGASLCVTVDCGAMAHDVLEQTKAGGLDIVVLDHHQMTLPAPPAVAVVNPNRPDDVSDLGNLSAVGVTFMALVALNRALRSDGFFTEKLPEPKLLQWLDLVALGLLCDVMPLKGLTRVLVAQGLKVMGTFGDDLSNLATGNPGLAALANRSGAKGLASTYHLGFVIGPRINAAGRIGHARLAFDLMTTDDSAEAYALAEKLHLLNGERQSVEAEVVEAAIAQVEARRANADHDLIVVAKEGWHPGVIGIVAGRLKERYRCPAIVIGLDQGVGKGSGRSIAGVDLGAGIAAARAQGLLLSGGGHGMAAGLSVEEEKIPAFEAFLLEHIASSLEAAKANDILKIDSIIGLKSIHRQFTERLAAAGPFGNGNAEPRFLLENVYIKYADIKGGAHVAVTFADQLGATGRGIAFRVTDTALGDALISHGGRKMHLVGRVKADDWRGGNAAQLHIEDAAWAIE